MKENKKGINVVLMAPVPPPAGGIGRWADRYMGISDRYNIHIFHCDESLIGNRKVFGEKTKINIFQELKRTVKIWKSLRKQIKKANNNCVVHCSIPAYKNSLKREIISLKIARHYGVPFIIHFRSTISNSIQDNKGKRLLKKLLMKCSFCIVLNKDSFDYASNFIQSNKIQIVPNFISKNELIEKKHIEERLKTIIYTGGVTEEKGCDTIIEIAKRRNDLKFVMVGSVSNFIQTKVASSNIENICLTNEVDKNGVRELLDSADAFLFLSRFSGEGFSNAVVEAMARGLPCIVSDWAANKEQIGEKADKYSLCINPTDLDSAVKALSIIESKEVRSEISSYNIKRVKEEYLEDVIVNRYIDIYKSVLERKEND